MALGRASAGNVCVSTVSAWHLGSDTLAIGVNQASTAVYRGNGWIGTPRIPILRRGGECACVHPCFPHLVPVLGRFPSAVARAWRV